MGVALNATTIEAFENNFTISTSTAGPVLSERERVRMEFYQTYDVMTGVSNLPGLLVFITNDSFSHAGTSSHHLKILIFSETGVVPLLGNSRPLKFV